jgi:hypothetical protein
MKIQVEVAKSARMQAEVAESSVAELLAATVEEIYDDAEETVRSLTLANALLDLLVADPRWEGLATRFWDAVDQWMADAAPAAVQQLVAAEVARQLGETSQGAMVRGKRSTRAEAMVATEVTTQLRAQFTPVVEQHLTALRKILNDISDAAVQDFLNNRPRGRTT